MIVIETTSPCGIKLIQEVGNLRQSTSLGLVRQSQKSDGAVDQQLSNNGNLMSIFSKVIGDKSLTVTDGISTRTVG